MALSNAFNQYNNSKILTATPAELVLMLYMKYPVAKEFDKVYEYLQRRLIEANMKKDKEILEEVCGHIRSMRDTWKEVMRINRASGAL